MAQARTNRRALRREIGGRCCCGRRLLQRHQRAKIVARQHRSGVVQTQPTIIGLDLAKHVLHVHGVDAAGELVLRKKL